MVPAWLSFLSMHFLYHKKWYKLDSMWPRYDTFKDFKHYVLWKETYYTAGMEFLEQKALKDLQ